MRRVYLDHASGTPLDPRVLEAMRTCLEERLGNPSGLHRPAREARDAVEAARREIASLLHGRPEEIVFTASATEANNLALKGLALAASGRRRGIIAAATEHLSILHPLRTLAGAGFPVRLLPVDRHGLIDPDDLKEALRPDTLLVSVAHASGEIGTLQPLESIARVAHEAGALFHTDATMTAGLLPLPAGPEGPDLVTLTAALFYGPSGVGALRVALGLRLRPMIEGGTQEGGLRAGTEPVASIVGFGIAAQLAVREREPRAARAEALSARLRASLFETIRGLVPTGHPVRRLPGHLSLCVEGLEAEALLRGLDEAGVDAASGSACTTGASKPSHVLEAIGIGPALARGALLLTCGEANADDDPERGGAAIRATVARLRELSPLVAS